MKTRLLILMLWLITLPALAQWGRTTNSYFPTNSTITSSSWIPINMGGTNDQNLHALRLATTNQLNDATNTLRTALDNAYAAADTVVSNALTAKLGATNTAITSAYGAADTVVSNGLSARLIATNDYLVTLIGPDPRFTSSSGTITATSNTLAATTFSGSGGALTLDASGFNGNLTTSDNTVQEVAQKLDDLSVGGSQTPWLSDIDADQFSLTNVSAVTASNFFTTNIFSLSKSNGFAYFDSTGELVMTNNGAVLTNLPVTALQGSGGSGTASSNGTAGLSMLSAGNGGVYWGNPVANLYATNFSGVVSNWVDSAQTIVVDTWYTNNTSYWLEVQNSIYLVNNGAGMLFEVDTNVTDGVAADYFIRAAQDTDAITTLSVIQSYAVPPGAAWRWNNSAGDADIDHTGSGLQLVYYASVADPSQYLTNNSSVTWTNNTGIYGNGAGLTNIAGSNSIVAGSITADRLASTSGSGTTVVLSTNSTFEITNSSGAYSFPLAINSGGVPIVRVGTFGASPHWRAMSFGTGAGINEGRIIYRENFGFQLTQGGGTSFATFLSSGAGSTTASFYSPAVTSVTITPTNGVIHPARTVPPALTQGGAQVWSDGTNLCVIIQDAGGARTTNKLTMSAWP